MWDTLLKSLKTSVYTAKAEAGGVRAEYDMLCTKGNEVAEKLGHEMTIRGTT